MKGINDIEELILSVRDSRSKENITEAFNAYKGGAYKSAIISTWVSVVYDVIYKISELSQYGDKAASEIITKFHNILEINSQDKSKIRKLQEFENNLLNLAFNNFELINASELRLLNRIKEDRNLSAHPSFIKKDSAYEPSAEQVKTHIVHSINFLLNQRPTQGKSVFKDVINDLKRNSFPKRYKEAKIFLKSKYLDRSKRNLIKDLAIGLLKGLLNGEILEPDIKNNVINTLNVISEESPVYYNDILRDNLSSIIRNLTDENLWNVVLFISSNQTYWTLIDSHDQLRIVELIEKTENKSPLISKYFHYLRKIEIKEIRDKLEAKFSALKDRIIEAIQVYSKSRSYKGAAKNGEELIKPLVNVFSVEYVDYLIRMMIENRLDQIIFAENTPEILEAIFDNTKIDLDLTIDYWKKLLPKLKENEIDYLSLIRKIENDL